FSSYTQWWFSSPAMLPEMIASWALCLGCAVHLLKKSKPWQLALAMAGFIFFSINFILCLYPPYQIPLLILGAAILLGVHLEAKRDSNQEVVSTARGLVRVTLALLLVGLILVPFWLDVRPTLALVQQTVYPGARRTTGGALSLFSLFSGVIGFFETEQVGPRIYRNIAEASNFYPLWPAAALAAAIAWIRGRIQIQPLFATLGITLVTLSLYCVIPWPSSISRATFLAFSTERRTLLALGLANIFFCCLFFDRYREPILARAAAWGGAVACWVAMAALLWSLNAKDPAYFSDRMLLFLPLLINTAVLALFFWERLRKCLPAVLGVLFIVSNAGINPVMAGLKPLMSSEAFRTIERIHRAEPKGKWIAFRTRYFAQLVKATGAPVFNGTQAVPDLPFLYQLDPGGANEFTYNRYANIECELPRPGRRNSVDGGLVYPDLYILFMAPDHPALVRAGYDFVVFPNAWADAKNYGFSLVEKVDQGDLWIYRAAATTSKFRPDQGQIQNQLAHF
ncbi:MAG: DUF7657 domain-containing protein, partial [Chthoniobacterales bacterium]